MAVVAGGEVGQPVGRVRRPSLPERVGMGLVIAPVTSTVLAGISPQLVGSAAGVLATVQQVGGALGIPLICLVFYGANSFPLSFGHSLLALTMLELVLVGLVQLLPRQTE